MELGISLERKIDTNCLGNDDVFGSFVTTCFCLYEATHWIRKTFAL
jgi:hypothetical protein